MKKLTVLGLTMTMAFAASAASANLGPKLSSDLCDNGSGIPGVPTPCTTSSSVTNVVDVVNYLYTNAGVATSFGTNSDIDGLQLPAPSYTFTPTLPGGVIAFISVSAGSNKVPGVYDSSNPSDMTFFPNSFVGEDVLLGDGSISDPYPGVLNTYSSFGVVINSDNGGATYYNDPALNPAGADLFLAYDLSALNGATIWLDTNGDDIADTQMILQDTYLLTLEDKNWNFMNSDEDFNDSIFLVNNVTLQPVATPEPMTMFMMGSGLLGMAGLKRRKK